MAPRPVILQALSIASAIFAGCSSRADKAPRVTIDPATAATQAIEQFDSNGDSVLSNAESLSSPGLASVFTSYDIDGNGSLTVEEITEGVQRLNDRGLPIAVEIQVVSGARGIPKAEVTLQPAAFLGSDLPVAQGVTDAEGLGRVHAFDYPFPERLQNQGYMFPGIYDVKVWLPSQKKELEPVGAVIDNTAIAGRAIKIEVQPNGKAVIKLAK